MVYHLSSFYTGLCYEPVLGSARTGLIFTRTQEGAQPGGLTQPQPGQTEPGIPYHVPSWWVPVGKGGGAAGTLSRLRRAEQRFGPREQFCSAGLFCIFPFFCIFVVPVPFVCCYVKLPLSRPTSFLPVSFHSPLHPAGGRGGRVALLLPAAAKTRTKGTSPLKKTGMKGCISIIISYTTPVNENVFNNSIDLNQISDFLRGFIISNKCSSTRYIT